VKDEPVFHMNNDDREQNVRHFLELIRQSRKGKFKLYLGMIAGVGKTHRMLEETKSLLQNGADVKIGYIETHGREEVVKLAEGLPTIPRKKVFYKGKEIEEMDVQAILNIHPEIVIVDELAHSNIPGSRNEKRWQDVVEILNAGINVISAVNIQHIDSLSAEVEGITGIEIKERVPDMILGQADEIVNIDLPADELIVRLKEGKIYHPSKVDIALRNFFQPEKILQLRKLALKEVVGQVERKIESEILTASRQRSEKFLACVSSNEKNARKLIRKTSRMANFYSSQWYVLYVQNSHESPERINLATQRHLLNNLKLATELGAEVIRKKSNDIPGTIYATALEKQVTTILVGLSAISIFNTLRGKNIIRQLLAKISGTKIDLIIVS
jgi:two-component system, OmpR family, sensor histidine kinase KdpD